MIAAVACLWASGVYADTLLPLDPAESFLHFTGYSFLHNFQGEAKAITGSATVNMSATPPIQTAKLIFKTTELTTLNNKRDENMKQWMHVDIHPEVDFSLEKVTPISGDYKTATQQQPARFSVAGTLTLNGVKQRITGEALGWREKGRLIVTGGIELNTLKFDLPQIKMVVLTVAPEVKTSYRFSFKLPPEFTQK